MSERREHETDPDAESAERDTDTDPGASDASAAADTPPPVPTDDESPLGDTDQHSDA